MKLKIILFIGLFIYQVGWTQRYNIKTFTTKEGLSNNYINSIEKDKKGFLWVATANGLCRFDGNYCTKFYNTPKKSETLADNAMSKVFCDAKGNMWVTHSIGLSPQPHKTTIAHI